MKEINPFGFFWQTLDKTSNTKRRLHHWIFLLRYSTFILSWVIPFVVLTPVWGGGSFLHAQEEPYFSITGPCNLEFPEAHGSHPGFRTEWWYYTGNLRSQAGDHYGFQLTFFRRQLSPPGTEKTWPQPRSAWRSQQLFLAHAALSDIGGKRFRHAEQMSREMPGLAGAYQDNGMTSVYVKDWSSRMEGPQHTLEVKADDFAFRLRLVSSSMPVLQGNAGYSRKGAATESASCYYSLTRLEADGEVSLGGRSFSVQGKAWMDHEFSSAPLEPTIEGWDWFSLQLSNNTEFMIYLLRKKDGGISEASCGTFVDASGKALHLAHDAIKVEVLDHWQSPRSGAAYPSEWQLSIHSLQLDLRIRPQLIDQELQTPGTTGITYWEGSVSAGGTVAGKAVLGEGYVELTGYAGSMDGRM